MPFSRDALSTIVERIKNNMQLKIKDENGQPIDAHTKGTGYTELAEVIGAVSHELRGNQAWIANQILSTTADDDTIIRQAAELNIPRIAAAFATGVITVTGNDSATIDANEVLQHSNGQQYRVITAATIVAGTASLNVIALVAGAAGNLAAGQTLAFINSVDGVDNTGTTTGINGGSEAESIERLLERLLERKQLPPMGGKDYDYIAWAKAAHVDVTRVFPFIHENGLGSVTVRFVTEELATPIPTQSHIDAVTAYIATQRPTGLRNLTIEAPVANPLDLTFTSLTENTPAVQAAVAAELQDLLRRKGGCGKTLLLSNIRAAISNAAGEEDFNITLVADHVSTDSQFPTLGVITWPGQ